MTAVQLSLALCVCVCEREPVQLLFPCSQRDRCAEWLSADPECFAFFHAANLRRRAGICQGDWKRGVRVGWGGIHAIALPGPTPQQDHAHAGEVGGSQFHGRYDGRWLQRRPSQRLGSAAEIPVHPTGLPGTVARRDRVFGGSHRKTDPHPEGDQTAAVVHRLRRVSITCMRPSFLPRSILWKWARSSWTTESTHTGVNRKHKPLSLFFYLLWSTSHMFQMINRFKYSWWLYNAPCQILL